jgi:hypothetical protein
MLRLLSMTHVPLKFIFAADAMPKLTAKMKTAKLLRVMVRLISFLLPFD